MIPLLSAAIQLGARRDDRPGQDIILAAYRGAMDENEATEFGTFEPYLGSGYPGRFAHCVLGTFLQLGASIRTWPKLAEELEQKGRIPRAKPNQTKYRREIHVSLWKVLVSLQALGQTKQQISELLARHGL